MINTFFWSKRIYLYDYDNFEGLKMEKKKHLAFTMLELVMVIVVLGILAALAMPRMERDIRQEAADNVLSAIRYTQHLALMDNVVEPTNRRWHRKFWRFGKEGCSDNGIFYYIGSDKDKGGGIDVDKGEEAIDPANGMIMMGVNNKPCEDDLSEQEYTVGSDTYVSSPNIFLTKKYGISEGKFTFSCTSGKYISFDYLGRPHVDNANSEKPNYSTLLHSDCNITLKFDDMSIPNVVITVEKETGHAFIVGQPDS